ncbi:hypothetical protein F4782DRAFT_551217 [Xylaria castorea]|nr:hypothetical protein F4782DRAFT_551217 [Xylaria castorea]
MCWRPFYLRRFVLLGFISVFILIIVAIEALLAISNRDHGIATSTSAKHYLWKYGPTAFLTGVAALWARTEYQSKLVAPWIHLSQNPGPASHTLLLDYISQFSLFAIFTSLSRRDFTVSIALTVSIVLKILTIISTSLISLSWIGLNQNSHPMLLLDRFVDSNVKLLTTGGLATLVLQGLHDQNLQLPEGISSNYAFQSVKTDLPDTAETNVTVDGLVNSLNCLSVDLTLAGATPIGKSGPSWLNLTVSSPRCNVSIASPETIDENFLLLHSTLFARFTQVQCDGISGDSGKRVLVMFGNMSYHADSSMNISDPDYGTINLNNSTTLLCIPEYAIERVQVIRNNTQTKSVIPVQGVPRRILQSVTAWDIMEAHFIAGQAEALIIYLLGGGSFNVSAATINIDPYIFAALYSQLKPGSQATDLFDPNVLQRIAVDYYRQIGAIIVKRSLMEPASMDTVGSVTINESRLIVSSWIAQWMVTLVAICIILTASALLIVPTRGSLPCSPSTHSGLISILLQSRRLSAQLRYAGASDNKHLVQFLRQSTFQSGLAYDPVSNQNRFCVIDVDCSPNEISRRFPQISSKLSYPPILHPACHSILCLSLVGLIITLELLLRKSNLETGLGDVYNDTYIHYTWTAIPALFLGLLSMTLSAVDFQIRLLAPYMTLKQYVSRNVFKQLELLDMAVLVAIYHEIRLRNFWAVATTTALLLSSLFTTFSASLFQNLNTPTKMPMILQPSRSFLASTYSDDRVFDSEISGILSEIPSLILGSNFSFPRFTYMDLAFTELTAVTAIPPNSTFGGSAVSISAVIPAVRGRIDCASYKPDQIHIDLQRNVHTSPDEYQNILFVWIEGQGSPEDVDFFFHLEDNVTYVASSSPSNYLTRDDMLYFWAQVDMGANFTIHHTAALSCNATCEALDVDTTFVGTGFDLDFGNPPQPLESTVRNTNISELAFTSGYDDEYESLVTIDVSPQLLDNFFALLVTSPWAIPMTALGDPSMNDDVIAAIRLYHGIIMAQRVRSLLVPANETNVTLAGTIGPSDNDAQRRINATATDFTGRRRLVQDAASTHILVALLATTLVLFIIGWATSPSPVVLPRSPTTIASTIALLAGGNIFDRLPPNTPFLSPEETASALGGPDTQFWMGWGNLKDEEGIEYGGENEAGVSQFGIFVVDKGDMHQP